MAEWRKTSCALCAQNCGLRVMVEGNRITRVRGDEGSPRSKGYVCLKGQKIAHFQHHSQRLKHPLKRVGTGFEQISWDQAIAEVADRLGTVAAKHGPRAVAYMGGGGQGCHFEAAFGRALLHGLGSHYHYNPLAQELTGMFWVNGRVFGKQYLHTLTDHDNAEMLLVVGWNGYASHHTPDARRMLNRFSKDPDKLLVVIDPRLSETARRANVHLRIRPGTDALCTRAMIAMVLQEGWQNTEYINRHVTGFDRVLGWFADFDFKAACEVCELDLDTVRDVTHKFATLRSCMHPDLGVVMNRHSTASSYLEVILMAICGRIGMPGGNVFPGTIMPLGPHTDERDSRTWRTRATDFSAVMGYFPPNVMPEEILSDRPDRLRAVVLGGSNPLRSYADTTAYEMAFKALDLAVTVEVAFSETAAVSDYVLPALSAYEKWDGTFFAWTYPEVYFQMRRPVLEPEGEGKEEGEIYTLLAERLGLVPEIPRDLCLAAKRDRAEFGLSLAQYLASSPSAAKGLPFVVAKTLGQELGSAHLAALWGMVQAAPPIFRANAVRSGFDGGAGQGEEIFQAILDHPEGLWIGKCDSDNNLAALQTPDGRIDIHIPELESWVCGIDAESEREACIPDGKYPLVLMAGRHYDHNANTLMRDPAWSKGARACTLTMHPEDARVLGAADGQAVRVTTEAGSIEIELEITDAEPRGHVSIPHGFGLEYEGKTYGANVNRLTKNTHRDRLVATPIHKYVPCRVEKR